MDGRSFNRLEWSLLGLWMIHLFAVKEQIDIGEPPSQTSAALAIQVVRSILFLWCEIPEEGDDFHSQLQNAVIDSYERHSQKQARYQPNKKDTPSAGKPQIITATAKHKHRLKRYQQSLETAS